MESSKASSSFADTYKSKDKGIERRALRAHRRSLEWKNKRGAVIGKFRKINLGDLTPLKESQAENLTKNPTRDHSKSNARSSAKTDEKSSRSRPAKKTLAENKPSFGGNSSSVKTAGCDGSSKRSQSRSNALEEGKDTSKEKVSTETLKGEARRDMLLKWKQERELKKKLEARNRQKPAFKVFHLEPEVNFADNQATKVVTGIKTSKQPDKKTHSGTNAGIVRPPQPPKAKVIKEKPVVEVRPLRTTRASAAAAKSSMENGAATGKARNITKPIPGTTTTVRPKAAASKVQLQTRTRRTTGPTPGASSKTSENTSARKTRSKASTISAAAPSKDVHVKNNDETLKSEDNLKIRFDRGEAVDCSFAPADFQFNAPSNLTSFMFKPLSPRSANDFLFPDQSVLETISPPSSKRCSTPKEFKTRSSLVQRSPVQAPIEEGSETLPPSAPVMQLVADSPESSAVKKRSSFTPTDASSEEECQPTAPAEQVSVKKTSKSRKSLLQKEELSSSQNSDSDKSTPSRMARSTRRSQIVSSTGDNGSPSLRRSRRTSVAEQEGAVVSKQDKPSSATPLKSSGRKSLLSRNEEAMDTGPEVEDEVKSGQESSCSGKADSSEEVCDVAGNAVCSREENENIVKTVQTPRRMKDETVTKQTPLQVSFSKEGLQNEVIEEEPAPDTDKANLLTPGELTKRTRRYTTPHPSVKTLLSDKKKTPRMYRNSLILRNLSPEEGVEILSMSPMVEMSRGKTPKSRLSRSAENFAPLPVFDDIEEKASSSCPLNIDQCMSDGDVPNLRLDYSSNTSNTSAEPQTSTVEYKEPSAAVEVSTLEEPIVATPDATMPEPEHDVSYFRKLVDSERTRLQQACDKWESISKETQNLSEEVAGSVRIVVGKAQLLMAQRFKQFLGLVDNCEFKTGEKPILCSDLQGFWDMVFFQVEDVDTKFTELQKLQANGWKDEKPQPPKKKKVPTATLR